MPSHRKQQQQQHNRRSSKSLGLVNVTQSDGQRSFLSLDDEVAERSGCEIANGRFDKLCVSEEQKKIANLVQLNGSLVKEISALRAVKSQMGDVDERVKKLEEELEGNRSRINALVVEKNCVESEKRGYENEIAALAKEVASLAHENAGLHEEKQSMLAEKCALKSALSESSARVSEIATEICGAQLNSVLTQGQVDDLNLRIEDLISEKDKLAKENAVLQKRQSTKEEIIFQLQLNNKKLGDELARLLESLAAEKVRFSDTSKAIEGFRIEVLNLKEDREKRKEEADEVQRSVVDLENHRRSLISRQKELEAQAHGLEKDLQASRDAYERSSLALVQEKELNESLTKLLENMHSKSTSLEKDLNSAMLSLSRMEVNASKDRKCISLLEFKLSELHGEKATLEGCKISLVIEANEAAKREKNMEENHRLLACRQEELEAQILVLQNDLQTARDSLEITCLFLEEEKNSKESLANSVQDAQSKIQELQGDLDLARFSLSSMEADAIRKQQSISLLESKVSDLVEKNSSLEASKTILQDEVKKLKVSFVEASTKAKSERVQFNGKVRQLELELDQAKDQTCSSGQTVYKLKAELQFIRALLDRKSKFAKLALSVAAMSTTTLVVVGMLDFVRGVKN